MDRFRQLLQGWLGKVLLGLIILPFALFGIDGLFSGGGSGTAAIEVNDVEISEPELQQAVENRRQRLVEQLGGGIDPSLITEDMVRPDAVESLIQRRLMVDALEQEGMRVADHTVKAQVRAMPQFHDEKGIFSQQILERVLAQAGYTTTRFAEDMAHDLGTQLLQSAIVESAFVLDREIDNIKRIQNETRDMDVMIIDPAALKSRAIVTDEQIESHYKSNKSRYMTAERARVEYLKFTQADFVDANAAVDEAQVAEQYEKRVQLAKAGERRRASHILVTTDDDRNEDEAAAFTADLLKQLESGASFEVLAKANSEDPGSRDKGGDLGVASRGTYDQTFEEALYALQQVGQLSPVTKTEFGYHIIKLTGIESVAVPTLDELKPAILSEIRLEKAREAMTIAVDEINRLAFESGDLSVIAEQYKKSVDTSDWINRGNGTGIFTDKKVMDAIFSEGVLAEGRNSDAIELEDGGLLVLRLAEHQPERQQPLEEVRDQVKEDALAVSAQKMAADLGSEFVTKLRQRFDIVPRMDQLGLKWESHTGIRRDASTPSRDVVKRAYEMPRPKDGAPTYVNGVLEEKIVVIALKSVSQGTGDESVSEELEKALAYQAGAIDFQSYIATQRDAAEIVIHAKSEAPSSP